MDEDEDMGDLPAPREGAPLVFGTLSDAVGRTAAGVAAAVEAGNVQLASTAEHLELSLVRNLACHGAAHARSRWACSSAPRALTLLLFLHAARRSPRRRANARSRC